jgi:hypothetical protein
VLTENGAKIAPSTYCEAHRRRSSRRALRDGEITELIRAPRAPVPGSVRCPQDVALPARTRPRPGPVHRGAADGRTGLDRRTGAGNGSGPRSSTRETSGRVIWSTGTPPHGAESPDEEVCCGTVTRTGRPAMRSPGRPPARREVERAFWVRVAEGMTSENAAAACGVSGPAGSRWFQERGGMSPFESSVPTGRYLSILEREEIAILRTQGFGVRRIAGQLGRDPSTISRELRRNAATRGGSWSIGCRWRSGRPS